MADLSRAVLALFPQGELLWHHYRMTVEASRNLHTLPIFCSKLGRVYAWLPHATNEVNRIRVAAGGGRVPPGHGLCNSLFILKSNSSHLLHQQRATLATVSTFHCLASWVHAIACLTRLSTISLQLATNIAISACINNIVGIQACAS